MLRIIFSVFLLISGNAVFADEYTDFYFAAKSMVSIDLMHQADYKSGSFGAPFVFVEKPITGAEVLGLSPYGIVGGDYHNPDEYDNGSVPTWVFELTDLALKIEHWKALFRAKGITTSVWREHLIAYEDEQLALVREGKSLDRLSNLNPHLDGPPTGNAKITELLYRAAYYREESDCSQRSTAQVDDGYYTVWYHTCTPLKLMAFQLELLNEIAQSTNLSPAEKAMVKMLSAAIKYVNERNSDRNVFLIWEPSCECGNGFFSVQIDVAPPNDGILIASEFSYLVCQKVLRVDPTNLSACSGTHQLGNGQKIHLSGDYRYQLTNQSSLPTRIRAIRLRSEDVDGRTIVFSASGHRINP